MFGKAYPAGSRNLCLLLLHFPEYRMILMSENPEICFGIIGSDRSDGAMTKLDFLSRKSYNKKRKFVRRIICYMEQSVYLLIGLLCAVLILLVILLILTFSGRRNRISGEELLRVRSELLSSQEAMRSSIEGSTRQSVHLLGDVLTRNQKVTDELQRQKLDEIGKGFTERQNLQSLSISQHLSQLEERFKTFESQNEQRLESIRLTIERRLASIQEENSKKLEEMRQTVDEKLQKTLEDKMNESFRLVSERLEQVYKGLGEMQNLAVGVGDLKKVLSNVKTRGILGEIQLGAILEEILSPEQYRTNVVTVPGTNNAVEYAIALPGNESGVVYLPIDSKFPADAYADLQSAYETGDPEAVNAAFAVLSRRIRSFAKDIHDKYIEPPYTTEFGIMFVPFEGLYAEAVNRGLVETLQRDYKINIAGPSTMGALLNSIQMGFRTVAIQKRTSEVWKILGVVKGEFDKFGTILEATQKKLVAANDDLDKLVGVRTRAIQRSLRNIEKIDEPNQGVFYLDAEDPLSGENDDENGSENS